MLLQLPDVLSKEQLRHLRQRLNGADFIEGKLADGPLSNELGEEIEKSIQNAPKFLAAALPLKIFPIQLYRCCGKQSEDLALGFKGVRSIPGEKQDVRTDLSAVLFLSDRAEYEGGELIIDTYGSQNLAPPEGHLVLHPSAGRHRILKVSKGTAYFAA